MLSDNSKLLLDRFEAKYVTMLRMVSDIAAINMGERPERNDLEKLIFNQQQEIHEAASRLKCCK